MGYTVSPVLGMKLFDPATIQAFEPVEVNANLMKLENGIKADRVDLASDDLRIVGLEGDMNSAQGSINTAQTDIALLQLSKKQRKLDATVATINTITQYGIGKIDGDSTSGINETLVFPTAFASPPTVIISAQGYRASGTFNNAGTSGGTPLVAGVAATTASQCQVYLETSNGSATGVGYDYYYSWIAIGSKP